MSCGGQWETDARGATRVTHELVGEAPGGRDQDLLHLRAGLPTPVLGARGGRLIRSSWLRALPSGNTGPTSRWMASIGGLGG